MKSAVRRVLLLSALMSPNALFALGLGEIHLNSALNQPFDADIDLVSAADEDLTALRASLASNDTFARYGLDKPAYLSDFTFSSVSIEGTRAVVLGALLIFSQVILSFQLSFAVFPLVMFTSDREKMGEFVNPPWLKWTAYAVASVIAALNAWLLVQTVRGWVS